MNIEKGDELLIKAVAVERSCDGQDCVVIGTDSFNSQDRLVVKKTSIIKHTPKPNPLAPGDRVGIKGSGASGEVLAIKEERVWVRWDNHQHGTHRLKALIRTTTND